MKKKIQSYFGNKKINSLIKISECILEKQNEFNPKKKFPKII